MRNQTPPTDGMWRKLTDVARGLLHRKGIDGPTFQYILGHPDFVHRLGLLLGDVAGDYRRRQAKIDRPPFLKCRVGTFRTVERLKHEVLGSNCRLSNGARCLLDGEGFEASITTSLEQPEQEVAFVHVTNAELGYPEGCTIRETLKAGERFGLHLCQPTDAAEIRINYLTQPYTGDMDILWSAMEPLSWPGESERGYVFFVCNNGNTNNGSNGLWLMASDGDDGSPRHIWPGDTRWVFRCSQSQLQ